MVVGIEAAATGSDASAIGRLRRCARSDSPARYEAGGAITGVPAASDSMITSPNGFGQSLGKTVAAASA